MTPRDDNRAAQKTPVPAPYGDYVYADEISLVDLWGIVWKGKWIIGGVTLLFGVVSIVVALLFPDIYKSETLLAPASGDEKSAMTGLASQFSGLANLAGINMGSPTVDKTTIAIETLKSRAFLTDFISRRNLLVPLFAAKGWDFGSNAWVINRDIYDPDTQSWVRNVKPPQQARPSDWEAFDALSAQLAVTRDKNTGLVKVAIESLSPMVARQWVDWLVEDINQHMRNIDLREASRSIDYLQEQVGRTSINEMRNIFFQLIEYQTKTKMLAEIRGEYVFKVIDPAVVAERKAKPNRALIVVIGALLGVVVGVVIAFFMSARRQTLDDGASAPVTIESR